MREILFRGKCIDDTCLKCKWLEGDIIHDGVTGKHYINTENCLNESDIVGEEGLLRFVAYEVDPETVCQYTGLTDKNGRKIFEGDIVQYVDEVIGKEKVDEVEYNETHAAFCRIHKSKMGLQYLFIDEAVANKCEVIGNIFDNPELIGE